MIFKRAVQFAAASDATIHLPDALALLVGKRELFLHFRLASPDVHQRFELAAAALHASRGAATHGHTPTNPRSLKEASGNSAAQAVCSLTLAPPSPQNRSPDKSDSQPERAARTHIPFFDLME